MTHFDDLAPCTYFRGSVDTGPLLAIGWLEPKHPYTRGDTGQEFYDRLKRLFRTLWVPVAFMGGQACRLCRYDGDYSFQNIFIPANGVTYVALEGILHYLVAHDYCPPTKFREAVKNCPQMDTPAYFAALQAAGWSAQVADYERHKEDIEMTRRRAAVRAAGDAWVARIEAYHEATGQWPRNLQDTAAFVPDDAAWRYAVTEENYKLELTAGAGPAFRPMVWYRKKRIWLH